MTFPVFIEIFSLRLHPHLVFEVLAYATTVVVWRASRHRWPQALPGVEKRLWLSLGILLGALIGSKLLAWWEWWGDMSTHEDGMPAWLRGKSIVGALLGGWAGAEIAKRISGITHSTGDAFVFPLIMGMAVGRIGCFLTGLEDRTHGVETALPWGVDFGDGIARHPTQVYDMLLLTVLGVLLWLGTRHRRLPNGMLFCWFLASYLLWRLGVDFLKPREIRLVGLSAIQLACVFGTVVVMVRAHMLGKRASERSRQESL